jgi:type VI secretion system protein ImpB
MSRSFQNEIPKARVNIMLDVATNGASRKKELPLKFLAVGDFSGGKSTGALQNRDRIGIDKNNFDGVIKELSPTLNLVVKNKLNESSMELPVKLTFESLRDFRPENIVNQVPELKRLLAMRNLLKDLKSNVLDNKKLRTALEQALNDSSTLQALRDELEQLTTEFQGE